jgi:hypothetical protein
MATMRKAMQAPAESAGNAGSSGGNGTRPPRGRSSKRAKGSGLPSSRGSKILIGAVVALAVVIGLFFALDRFITDVMWFDQLGFQSVVWDAARDQGGSVGGLCRAHGRSGFGVRRIGYQSAA